MKFLDSIEGLYEHIPRKQVYVPSAEGPLKVKDTPRTARSRNQRDGPPLVAAPAALVAAPAVVVGMEQMEFAERIAKENKLFRVNLRNLQHRTDPPQTVPRLVLQCTALIEDSLLAGLRVRNLFRDYSNDRSEKVNSVADSFCAGYSSDLVSCGCDALTASMLLLAFLQLLPDPLIPLDLQECMLGAQGDCM